MRLIDTSAWVEYFKGTPKGKKVKAMIAEGETYTSAITLAEITKWFNENNLPVEIALHQIKTNSILIPVEEEILIESGKLYTHLRKRKPKIGLIDVIIYSSALLHDLTLITKDSDFSGLPKVEMI